MEHIGNLLHGVFATFEQGFCFEDNEVGNPFTGKTTAYVMYDLRQIFGSNTQYIGI